MEELSNFSEPVQITIIISSVVVILGFFYVLYKISRG